MAQAPTPREELIAAADALRLHGSKAAAARALSLRESTFESRINAARLEGIDIPEPVKFSPPGRKETDLYDGVILIASDAHYFPGEPSTAHRAFVRFCKRMKPAIVVMNGDVLDAATISRHPPIGWNHLPSVKEELDVCQERLGEIAKAAFKAKKLWPLGNHDARFETKLATVAPEFKDVKGISLSDHFADWTPCWSLHVNDDLVIKHRLKGGLHAPSNNALWAGKSIVTGHLHAQTVREITDYTGTRWGVDTGCLADVFGPQFAYMEDNPRGWRSGFCVITYRDGRLLTPELVRVIEEGLVEFRGELISV